MTTAIFIIKSKNRTPQSLNLRHLVFPCTGVYTMAVGLFTAHSPCVPFGMAHPYALIPSKGLPSGVSASKGWRVQRTKQLVLEVPFCVIIPCQHGGAIIMQRICAKDHGSPKCPSVVPFEILHSEEPFEVARFEHFGLERPFNMAAFIIAFTLKCPSEGVRSCLERTVSSLSSLRAGLR